MVGIFSYIAFAGGLDIQKVMDSYSTSTRFNIGGYRGRAIEEGDYINFKHTDISFRQISGRNVSSFSESCSSGPVSIRVIPSSEQPALTDVISESFYSQKYTISSKSDRMSYRLEGKRIEMDDQISIISEGTVWGDIQVPPDGQPIILMIGALSAFSKTGKLHHVKPHGALYNMASTDYDLAKAICEGIREVDDELILYGLANSQLIRAAQDTGLSYAQEVFADRNYNDDGTLVHRQHEEALITDEDRAVDRVVQMVEEGKVKSVTGKWINLQPDTVCVHGDNPKAVQFATRIHKALTEKRVTIAPVTGKLS